MVSRSPTAAGIRRVVASHADTTGDAIALLAPDREPTTYAALLAQIDDVSARLAAAAIGPSDRVAVVLPNGPDMAAAFLAVGSVAACAPLNPAYRDAEFEFYLTDLRARMVIVQAGLDSPCRAVARRLGIRIVELAPHAGAGRFELALDAAPAVDLPVPPAALILHTSGTTSRPKIVPLAPANLLASAANIGATLALTPADRCLNTMPLFHIHGLVGALLSSLAAGASVVCTPGFDAKLFFEELRARAPTWYSAVPTIHQAVANAAQRTALAGTWHHLRFIRSSSSPLAPQLLEALEARFGVPVIEAYGMTEAAHQMTSNPLPPGVRKPGSVGLARGLEVTVRDERGDAVPPGMTGEVMIRGANVMGGYEGGAELDQTAFVQGWFRTGDQGHLDADGYLVLDGRLKELINRGGEKIAPREVDEVLAEHPAVAQAVAFALPDPLYGEEVAAAIVLREGAEVSEAELRSFAANRLADFKLPRRIVFVPQIPKGPTGKLQRIGLAKVLGLDAAPAPSVKPAARGVSPRNDVQRVIAAAWCEVLGITDVGIQDDFFELGGQSLALARIAGKIREAFGVEIALPLLFQAPTVAEMSAIVATVRGQATRAPIARRRAGEATRASILQERMRIADALAAPGVYSIPTAIDLVGTLDVAALSAALAAVVARHEVLRTELVDAGDSLVAWVRDAVLPALPVVELDGELMPALLAEAARPFRLIGGELFRATLFRVGPQRHVLFLNMHHVISDGWSRETLWRELEAGYAGRILAPLSVQYGDFAEWQRGDLHEAAREALLGYWRTALAGAPSVLELPGDRPRSAAPTFRGGRVALELPAGTVAALAEVARGEGATQFMALLAVFAVLLARHTAQDDLVIGAPVAGRNRKELEALIGFFANTLPLRAHVDGAATFRSLLRATRATTLAALEHQDIPFELIVEALAPARVRGVSPFVQVMFSLVDEPRSPVLAGVASTFVEVYNATTPFDLMMQLWRGEAGVRGYLEYDAELFDASTIERMVAQFQGLVATLAREPDACLASVQVATDAERHQIAAWNATARPHAAVTTDALLEAQVDRTPDAIALCFGDERVTYRELDARANRLAHHLADLGAGRERVVAVLLERSVDLVVALLAVWKAGAAYVPLDPSHPRDRLAYIIEDSGARLVVTDSALVATVAADRTTVAIDRDRAAIASRPSTRPGATPVLAQLAYILYTSGSTGRPKGVAVQHGSLSNVLASLRGALALGAGDTMVAISTVSFDIAALELWLPLWVGARVVVCSEDEAMDPAQLGRQLAAHGATIFQATPATWRMLVQGGWAGRPDLVGISTGEALPADLAHALAGKVKRLWNLYGPTEITIYSAARVVDPDESPVRVGGPIDNTRHYILDRALGIVPIGVPGELYIGGEGLARGYHGRADLTSERFVPDPFGAPGSRMYRTGDLVRWRADGTFEFLGRLDHQVKIRGFRIELAEIEATLAAHAGVAEAVVVARGAGDARQLVAYVVPHSGAFDAAAVRAHLATRLPDYMIPAALVTLPALPLTTSGKVDRKALPAPDEGSLAHAAYLAPRTAEEKTIAAIVSDVLGVERVGIRDDFFALGGHSLLAVRVIAQVHAQLAVELPLRSLFDAPTVEGLAEAVARREVGVGRAPVPALAVASAAQLPLSYAQQRLWFVQQLSPASVAYTMLYARRLYGPLDVEALRSAFEELVRRHAALRTVFPTIRGEPFQHVVPAARWELAVEIADVDAAIREEQRRPFDLVAGPLLRTRLFQAGADEHVLVVAMHHIVSDGTSMEVFWRELAALYAGESLPALPVQYTDYAAWQRSWLVGDELVRQVAYWKEHLRGAPEQVELPFKGPRPVLQTSAGDELALPIEPQLTARVRALARREATTLFITLEAAFRALLFRYTGQPDVTLGTPVVNRNRTETEPLIGMFVNTLALRNEVHDDDSFTTLLAREKAMALEAYDHIDTPFEAIVSALRLDHRLDRSPLVQLLFRYDLGDSSVELPGLEVAPVEIRSCTAKFDISVATFDDGEQFSLRLIYNVDLFERRTIELLARHFIALLDQITRHPAQPLAQLDILSNEERQQVLAWQASGHAILDRAGSVVPIGVAGELYTAGEATGDRARWRTDGTFEVLGRVERPEAHAFFRVMLDGVTEPVLPFGAEPSPTTATTTIAADRLRAQADRLGVTLASLCHVAWGQVVARSSGREAVVFGTVQRGEVLPLRLDLDETGVETAVRRAHDVLAELARHDRAPEDAQRLIGAVLAYQEPLVDIDHPFALAVDPTGAALHLTAAERLCRMMVRALDQLATALEHAPNEPVRALDVIPPAERELVLETWNQTAAPFAADRCIHQLVEDQARRAPAAIAVVQDGVTLTYGELDARANRLAHRLIAVGVRPDAIVAVCLERRPAMIVALLAILKAGGAYLPLDPSYPPARLRELIGDARPAALITEPVGRAALDAAPAIPHVPLDDAHGEPATVPHVAGLDPSHLAYVIYTSGSTGRPKGVMITHRSFVNHLAWQVGHFGFSPADVVLQRTSISFDASVWELWTALAIGARLVLLPAGADREPAVIAATIAAHAVTIVQFVPSLLRMVMAAPDAPPFSCDYIFSGGERLDADLAAWAARRVRRAVVNLYGPTEATIDTLAWTYTDGSTRIPIGRPIANTRVYVLDPHQQPVPLGVPGELYIGGAALARGYLHRPELTAERFVVDPFSNEPSARLYRTGDLVRYLPDGNVEYLGRNDDQVKIRGFRIELGEIEAQLTAHASVRAAVVMARDSGEGDRRLVAYVTSHATVDVAELRDHLAARLPAHMVPVAFVALDALPLLPNGKVDRRALPAPGEHAFAHADYVAPRTPDEQTLAEIWHEVLGLERAGVGDDFFALGGNSLLAMRVIARIEEAFDLALPLSELFFSPTLEALASRILEIRAEGVDPELLAQLYAETVDS